MSFLAKTIQVLDFIPEESDAEASAFGKTNEDGYYVTTIALEPQHVADMHNPLQITVTIEPGDKLADRCAMDGSPIVAVHSFSQEEA